MQCASACLLVVVTTADILVSRAIVWAFSRGTAKDDQLSHNQHPALPVRVTRSGSRRPFFAVSTLRFETLATATIGCLVTFVLVLVTPAKPDSNRSECIVFRNMKPIHQG
jgi:hypothetical protein